MPAWQDYPRMMFHRTKAPVTVYSRDEEDALGAGWSRTLWPVATEVSHSATELSHPAAPKESDRPSLTYNKLTVDEPPWEDPPPPRNDEVSAFEPAPKHHAKPRGRPPAPAHHDKPKAARKK